MSLRPKKVDFDKTWAGLIKTIKGVMQFENVTKGSWNNSFEDIYSLCVAHPEPLADKLYSETKILLERHMERTCGFLQQLEIYDLLEGYCMTWSKFNTSIEYLNLLYRYLNNSFKDQRHTDSELSYTNIPMDDTAMTMKEIKQLGYELWKKMVLVRPIEEKLLPLILDGVEHIREMDKISSDTHKMPCLLEIAINSFILVQKYSKNKIQYYEEIFELPLLQSTGRYFSTEAAKLLQDNNVSAYMKKAIHILDLERKRANNVYPNSAKKVIAEFQRHLVENHLSILHAECKAIIHESRHSDLGNLYRLLKPVDGSLKVLLTEFQEYVETGGSNNLKHITELDQQNIAEAFVENILIIHGKYNKIIKDTLQNDLYFCSALDKAFISIVNRKYTAKTNSSELLGRYCDMLLKRAHKGLSEEEVDIKLEEAITVFKYINAKDAFQKFYAKNLAKRLIYQQSYSMENEEAMINRLKKVCGFEYTSKFQRMFTDISISDDLYSKFGKFANESQIVLPINCCVKVLQQGAWPLSQNTIAPLILPIEVEQSIRHYESFYLKQFSGRKLTWIHHMSYGEIRITYPPKVYLVTMNTHQMSIIFLFECSDNLHYKEIQEATKLPEEQLTKYLQTFLDCKMLIANNDKLGLECTISFNLQYNNKRTKFKIGSAIFKETPSEVQQTHRAIDDDRKMYIHATIVRIMKCRKLLKHGELIQEVLNQAKARFTPSVPMIKTCIDSLIDKAYIERAPNSSDMYSYVA